MTRQEARDLVREQMDIGEGRDALLNRYILESLRFMANELQHLHGRDQRTIPADDTSGVALPADFLRWKNGRIGSELFVISSREALIEDLPSQLDVSTVHYGYIWSDSSGNYKLFPKKSYSEAKTLDYDYFAMATEPASDSATLDTGGIEYENLFMADLCYRVAKWITKDPAMVQICLRDRAEEMRWARAARERQEHEPGSVSIQWP